MTKETISMSLEERDRLQIIWDSVSRCASEWLKKVYGVSDAEKLPAFISVGNDTHAMASLSRIRRLNSVYSLRQLRFRVTL